jgi:hypothetical protein
MLQKKEREENRKELTGTGRTNRSVDKVFKK